MVKVLACLLGMLLMLVFPIVANADGKVHANGIAICSVIINEMTEGRVGLKQAKAVATAIANAGNKYFGRVTCGDMWLYMAIVFVESGFRNNIVNYENCRGMFQVHAPSWASKFGIRYADLLDLETNAECGIQVFKYYLNLYGNVVPALSAYNSDHPHAARRYARNVLATRNKIKRRYIGLYAIYRDSPVLVAKTAVK